MPVVHWAQDHGIPLASLLRDTGLEPERFFDDGSRMNTAQRFQMLQNLISLADQPALGMSTGSRARLEEIGALGLAMLVAPSVADAVRAGAQLSPSSGLVGHLEVHPHEGGLLLRLVLPALSPALEQYITEDFFATVASYLATLTAGFPAGETRPPRWRRLASATPIRAAGISIARRSIPARCVSAPAIRNCCCLPDCYTSGRPWPTSSRFSRCAACARASCAR